MQGMSCSLALAVCVCLAVVVASAPGQRQAPQLLTSNRHQPKPPHFTGTMLHGSIILPYRTARSMSCHHCRPPVESWVATNLHSPQPDDGGAWNG